MKKQLIFLLIGLSFSACAKEYYYEYGEKVQLEKLNEQRTIEDKNISYYQTENGNKLGVGNEIIVECQENVDCENLLRTYGLIDISKLSNRLFLVKVEKKEQIFELSQKLYEDEAIVVAHPNFLKKKTRR